MENISPTLKCVRIIRGRMERGDPARAAVEFYLSAVSDEMSTATGQWLVKQSHQLKSQQNGNAYRRSLWRLLERGLRGESIVHILKQLEQEIEQVCDGEMQKFITLLPYRMLVPLLLCMFPAYLILLFGPILIQLVAAIT